MALDIQQKILAIGYMTVLAIMFTVAFNGIVDFPLPLLYLLVLFVFAIPAGMEHISPMGTFYHTILLLISAFSVMLLVTDPVEMGVYGYDPYSHTMPMLDLYKEESVTAVMADTGNWPGFFVLSLVVQSVLSISEVTLAKYLPLFAASIPVIFYTAVRHFSSPPVAFYAGLATAATRTLFRFEIKFVDEVLAVTLVFLLLLVILSVRSNKSRAFLGICISGVILISHHFVTVIATLIVSIMMASRALSEVDFIRWMGPNKTTFDQSSLFLILGTTFVTILVLFVPEFLEGMVGYLYRAIFLGDTLRLGGTRVVRSGNGRMTPRQLISAFAIPVLGVFCAIAAYGVLSKNEQSDTEFAWTVASAIFAGFYAVTLVVGRVVPLGPNRILIYLVPLLSAVGFVTIHTSSVPTAITIPRQTIALILLISLVATQIVALQPHHLYSDRSDNILGESHWSESEFAASRIASHYAPSETEIIGYEEDLWAAHDNQFRPRQYDTGQCDRRLRVWREPAGEPIPESKSIIINTGDVTLSYCTK